MPSTCLLPWLFQHLIIHLPFPKMFYLLCTLELVISGRLHVGEVRRSISGFLDLKLSLEFGASVIGRTIVFLWPSKARELVKLVPCERAPTFCDPRLEFQSLASEYCTLNQQLGAHNIPNHLARSRSHWYHTFWCFSHSHSTFITRPISYN